MKYMVIVNHKYIVAVDAITNAGAEHVILDNIHHAKSALAFAMDELKTETFKGFFETCETTSLNELKNRDRAMYAAELETVNEYKKNEMEIDGIIRNLQNEIETMKLNKAELTAEKNEFIKRHDLTDEFTRPEKLEELRYPVQTEVIEKIA